MGPSLSVCARLCFVPPWQLLQAHHRVFIVR
jgi:hypothetical protein